MIFLCGAVSAANIDVTTESGLNNAVNTASSGDTLNLAAGTYTEHDITINKDLTIIGQDQSNTIIDAQGQGRIFYISSGVTLTLQDITLTGGYVNDNGGAIYNSGTLNVKDSTFSGNTATGNGGAIFNYLGNLNINGCNFIDNHATGSYSPTGGAISNIAYGSSKFAATDSNFTGNSAVKGGAIYHEGTNLGTVTDCYFTSNRADYGGAICHIGNNFQIEGTWKVIFNGSPHYILPTFLYNTANYGGAIYNQGSASITYYNLIENTAGHGNAIYQDYSGTFTANSNYWGFDADPKTVPNTIAGSISNVITSSHLSTYYGVALSPKPLATRPPHILPPAAIIDNSNNQNGVNDDQNIGNNNDPTTQSVIAASNTIKMRETGISLAGFLLAVLIVLSGFISTEKKIMK